MPYISLQSNQKYNIVISKNSQKKYNIMVKFDSAQKASTDNNVVVKLIIEILLNILS